MSDFPAVIRNTNSWVVALRKLAAEGEKHALYPTEFTYLADELERLLALVESPRPTTYDQHKTAILDAQFLTDVADELRAARTKHAPINSAHEGYAVILEELEEFWEQVRLKRSLRDPGAMYRELVQVAAMAARTATDIDAGEQS